MVEYLNQQLAVSPALYRLALTAALHLPWLAAALTFCVMWFDGTPGAVRTDHRHITRLESRRRFLLYATGVGLVLLVGWQMQSAAWRDRPLDTMNLLNPLLPDEAQRLLTGVHGTSSFPAIPIGILSIALTAMWYANGWYAALLFVTLVISALAQMGTGLYWPADILAGALLGTLVTHLALYIVRPIEYHMTTLVLSIEKRAVLLYPFGFVFLVLLAGGGSV